MGDSIGLPKDHFDYVLENGGDGLAITDHGTALSFGYINQAKNDFKKKGVKFKSIFGVEAYFHPDLDEWAKVKAQKDEEAEEEGSVVEVEADSKGKLYWADPIKRRHHLVLLAKDFEGYQNLCRLITESYRKGFYRYPRMDLKSLEKHNKGLIISSACLHPDSIVETDKGAITIQKVVELVKNNEQVSVKSFNVETGKVVFNVITWGDKTRTNTKLLKVKLKDGKELKLTPDHKVFTDKGWVEAQFLRREHKILSL